jgi:hypothetical protein
VVVSGRRDEVGNALAAELRELGAQAEYMHADVRNGTKVNLVDAIVAIGDKTVTNYRHGTTRVPVDFPAAPKLAA